MSHIDKNVIRKLTLEFEKELNTLSKEVETPETCWDALVIKPQSKCSSLEKRLIKM